MIVITALFCSESKSMCAFSIHLRLKCTKFNFGYQVSASHPTEWCSLANFRDMTQEGREYTEGKRRKGGKRIRKPKTGKSRQRGRVRNLCPPILDQVYTVESASKKMKAVTDVDLCYIVLPVDGVLCKVDNIMK